MPLNVRIAPETHKALKEAQRRGQSFSRVVESTLQLGLGIESDIDDPVRGLMFLIMMAADASRVFSDVNAESWVDDPFSFRTLQLAVPRVLEMLEPEGEIVSPVEREAAHVFQGAPASVIESFRTPEARANEIVSFVWGWLNKPLDKVGVEHARSWKPHGARMLYVDRAMTAAYQQFGLKLKGPAGKE